MNPRTRRYSVTNPGYQIPTPGRLLAHDLALEAAGMVFRLVEKVPPSSRDLADQARRASSSVALNLAEASGRAGRDRLQHHRIAHGSAKETMSCIALLRTIGSIDRAPADQTLSLLDRVAAMTWKLARPR
jgi:four helix bundle protein